MRAGVNVRFLVAANDPLLSDRTGNERAGISGRSAPIRWIDVPTSLPRALHRAAHRDAPTGEPEEIALSNAGNVDRLRAKSNSTR
jgi:hypothetical protein